VLKKYTWGPDLAGQHGQPGSLESAGGIGGLLATRDEVLSKSYVHFYDANGNTGQLILRADGSTAAAYEYDAYGNVTAQTGSYAADNAWRFSTKQWDDETGQGYWGERYYDSGVGRWVSRDPVEMQEYLLPIRQFLHRVAMNRSRNAQWDATDVSLGSQVFARYRGGPAGDDTVVHLLLRMAKRGRRDAMAVGSWA
jgi:RHS repeat-associated protein